MDWCNFNHCGEVFIVLMVQHTNEFFVEKRSRSSLAEHPVFEQIFQGAVLSKERWVALLRMEIVENEDVKQHSHLHPSLSI